MAFGRRAGAVPGSAFEDAVSMLAARSRAEADLRRRLTMKGHDLAAVEAAMVRLRSAGLLDDRRVAASVARAGLVGSARSERRVLDDMARRGVTAGMARDEIAEVKVEENVGDAGNAVRAAERKVRSIRDEDPAVRRRKLLGWLARQGFAFDAAKSAVDAVLPRRPGGDDVEAPPDDSP